MAPLAQFGAVEANTYFFCSPAIGIVSPSPGNPYQETSIPIKVDVLTWGTNRRYVDIYYSLDGGSNITLDITTYEGGTSISGTGTLVNLTDGYHTMEAYSTDTQGRILSDSITFRVDATAPKISNLSVNNTDSGERILSFSVDSEASWVGYSLDNQANVTVAGDVVLGDLSFGSHNVTVYAEDSAGNMGASETLFFTIEPFPTTLIIATVITIAVVGIVLLLYFKKRKH
jgi:hypothetical protein